MSVDNAQAFAEALTNLVGQVAVNPSLGDAIVSALGSAKLTPQSGPIGVGQVMKGAPGSHSLKEFLKAWGAGAPHLSCQDVTGMVKAALSCYRLAEGRAHTVDTVWTGPEVAGSEVRRTEAVVSELIAGAEKELLIVGYWLVSSTVQIKSLIELLIKKVRSGTSVRFVFDPGEKPGSKDNFSALVEQWPANLKDAPRKVYSWGDGLTKATAKSGHQYDRKLHAKVIVADRKDALVTSANLTQAGLVENLEMGLRIRGGMAGAVVRHFDLLIEKKILERRYGV